MGSNRMSKAQLDLNGVPRFVMYVNPREYNAEHLTLEECTIAVQISQVQYRGWYFPHIDRRQRPRVGGHRQYMFQKTEVSSINDHVEEWRMYRSGQFAFRGMVWEHTNADFQAKAREESRRRDTSRDPNAIAGFLEFRMMIALITEAYTFAARLTQAAKYGESLTINVGFRDVQGFGLASNQFGLDLYDVYPIQVPDPHHERDIASQDLVAEPWSLAAEAAKVIFEEFGWLDAQPRMIAQHQHDLLRNR